jgi:hypothetical protein
MQHLKKFSSHPKFDKGRRKQIFAKILKMSTEGKESVLKLLLILGLLIFPQTVSISPSTLRGGLVYQEKTTQGPVYVNVETVTLIRKADTTDLLNSARTSRSMINTYQNFCRKVANRVTIFDTPRKPTRAEVDRTSNMFIHLTSTSHHSSTPSRTHLKCVKKWEDDDRKSATSSPWKQSDSPPSQKEL